MHDGSYRTVEVIKDLSKFEVTPKMSFFKKAEKNNRDFEVSQKQGCDPKLFFLIKSV